MDYEKKYKDALERARIWKDKSGMPKDKQGILDDIFPELKEEESEDERIRKEIIEYIKTGTYHKSWIAWLENQGVANKTINMDKFAQGVLREAAINLTIWIDYNVAEGNMCLSNMECKDIEDALVSGDWDKVYAYIRKKLEKQGEQKPADYENPNIQQNDFAPKSAMEAIKEEKVDNANKVEQKFKEGDWVVYQNQTFQVTKGSGNNLILQGRRYQTYFIEELCKPWTIDDAKDGDVLNSLRVQATIIFKGFSDDGKHILAYCALQKGFFIKQEMLWDRDFEPAPKNWTDELFNRMIEDGYEWDAEKKELNKIEQKPAWSEEDEIMLEAAISSINHESVMEGLRNRGVSYCIDSSEHLMKDLIDWLKSLKERYTWKPSDRELSAILAAIGDERQKSDAAKELLNIYQYLKKLMKE